MIGIVFRLLAALGFATALAALPGAAAAAPVNTGHLKADLVSQATSIAPGQTIHLALTQDIQKGWHTYWRNSGDSGEATVITWTLPAGWTAGDIIWAPPSREPTGPLMNYGYHGQVLLPVAITAPRDAHPGQTVTLQADAQFLVCADLCVPEDARLSITLPVTAAPGGPDPAWGGRIAQALDAAPKGDGLTAATSKDPKALKLAVVGAPLKGLDKADAYFFPFKANLIDHARPQAIERGPDGLTLTLALSATPPADSEYAQVAGVLELAGKAYEIHAAPGPLPAGASGLGAPVAKPAAAAGGFQMGLLAAVAFAFVGGLILNLMPCVFPILAMKAASLAGHGHDRREAQVQGLAFLAGSVATFLALAALLIAVRAAGAAVGWGFQLQSPPVVAVLALLMLAVALNLSGLFEVGSSLQGVGGRAASRGGAPGSFFTGALAVVVAAPCTAPFMGPALGWALTQPAAAALAVFAGLGLGFAAPFTAVTFAPGLLSNLPRPGAWMDGFRKLLSFPMYATAAWLAWVLTVQTDPTGLARLFAAAIVLALGVWLLGVAQRRSASGLAGARAAGLTGVLLVAVTVAIAVGKPYDEPVAAGARPADGAAIAFEPYSPEKLAAAQAAGKPVFVNYTAAWCVTCQVNEKVAFSTRRVADAFARTGAVYLKADWTRRDGAIAADLAHFGRAGVPLYLVYGAKGGEPEILPQLLTGDMAAKALEKAAGGQTGG
jgi:thiol:disulfide interchange protein